MYAEICQRVAWALVCGFFSLGPTVAMAETTRVYIGTYTSGSEGGIFVAEFDTESGRLFDLRLAGETENPSFLEVHPTAKTLYSVAELSAAGGVIDPSLIAWKIDEETGALTVLSRVSTRGSAPCHVAVDPEGKFVGAANYESGSVVVYRLIRAGDIGDELGYFRHDGNGPHAGRQSSAHAHSIQFSPDSKFALAADLGADELRVYEISSGGMVPFDPPYVRVPAGSGPRHFAFSRKGNRVYVLNELNGTISSLRWDAGKLEPEEDFDLLESEWSGDDAAAEILVHPRLDVLYASVRGSDLIVVFEVEESGRLRRAGEFPCGGNTPRNFRISPCGKWLLVANQDSDSIVVFEIDPNDGMLRETGQTIEVKGPVCIRFYAS